MEEIRTFADADDRVWPTWIESLVEGARQVDPRGEADIVAGASCWNRSLVSLGWHAFGDGDPWTDYRGLFQAGQQMDEVWKRMLDLPENTASISHSMCDKLFRTELAHRAMRGMDRSVRIGEDTCFNIVAFCLRHAPSYPASERPEDVLAAQNFNALRNWLYLDMAAWGAYNSLVWGKRPTKRPSHTLQRADQACSPTRERLP